VIKPLRIVGAQVWHAGKRELPRELNVTDRVIADPDPRALRIDLEGYTIFPGLINGHDHLDLNHYPRTKFRDKYDNAHQWGEDVNVHLNESPFKELRAYPHEDRLLIGGLKNLLCGALTVFHHDPPYAPLFKKSFPVRVIKEYGWAHSLHFNAEAKIVESYRKTPSNYPWFIHLAEGTDHIAQTEFQQLVKIGCVNANTVLIHGVGLTASDLYNHHTRNIHMVICPSTNQYLLSRLPIETALAFRSRLLIGSDSRLTADGDLLDEIRLYTAMIAETIKDHRDTVYPYALSCVTNHFRNFQTFSNYFSAIGHLDINAAADWIVLKHDYEPYKPEHLIDNAHRADLALVVRGGIPQIGDPDLMTKFPHVETVEATLDGIPKLINLHLARQIARSSLKEKGLEFLQSPFKNRWF